MTRLLLIGCSASKRPDPHPMQAGERYTGVFYRLISKVRREGKWPSDLQIAIISAKYGFLEETTLLPSYDQKMDHARACLLQEEVGLALDSFLERISCQEVFIALGKQYRVTLVCSHRLEALNREEHVHVCIASGIGKMLQETRNWILASS